MKPFVFSADSHIREPNELFLEGLPPSMKHAAIFAERTDEYIQTKTGDKVIHRLRWGGNTSAQQLKRRGASDILLRLEDMAMDGVDAEICFPQLGLYLYILEDPEIELASCQIYNDWNNSFFSSHLDRFVRCGVLPVRDLNNTVPELRRLAEMGFTAAMLPVVVPDGVPGYNQEDWDPVFAAAGELQVALVFHTGTGLTNVIQERGPGGAVINYTRQMNDGINTVLSLVAGGVLDRNPKAQIAIIEAGASWLPAVAERMDEVYHQHAFYVRPKLSRLPSQIVSQQVRASFQFDRAGVISRSVLGPQCFLFASDYPHMEGTFPRTKEVVARLFEGYDISEQDQYDILGGNALKLFRLSEPKVLEQSAA